MDNPDWNEIEFDLINDLKELNKLSANLKGFFNRFGLNLLDFHDINLVLEEWFTNLINHGFEPDNDSKIRIAIKVYTEEFLITVSDEGKYFDPREFDLPDLNQPLENRNVGGIGLHLIFKLMDSISYHRQNNINVLQLQRHRTK